MLLLWLLTLVCFESCELQAFVEPTKFLNMLGMRDGCNQVVCLTTDEDDRQEELSSLSSTRVLHVVLQSELQVV